FRIVSRDGEDSTWSMYHIDAGSGFAWISFCTRDRDDTSKASNISNIPNPASASEYPCFLYTYHQPTIRRDYIYSRSNKLTFIDQSLGKKFRHPFSKPFPSIQI